MQCSSHELDPHKNTRWVKSQIQQTCPIQLEDLQKHRSSIQKQIARFPLDAYVAIKPENFPELILCNFFNTRLQEVHTRSLCVTSSDVQA